METSTLEGPVHPATMQGMPLFETIASMGHEQLVLCQDAASGYRGIIAIHSTVLGPALGGTRFWSYPSDEAALIDCLRLARGMTYKRSEEHTSELQSHSDLVCRLLLEKKKKTA